jgi:hypothetical protein
MKGGAIVHIADLDNSLGSRVDDYAESHDTDFTAARGSGEFIGNTDHGGSDREQRDRGQSAYAAIIGSSTLSTDQGSSARDVWNDIRDRWAARISAAKVALSRLLKASDDDDDDDDTV